MAHIARGVQLARLLGFLAQPMVDRALLIVGANGTGKTTLVSDAVKALSATSFDSHVRVLHYQAGTSDEHFERRLVEFERDVVSKINDATATNASKQDAVARSLRELGQKETGSIVSAYEHLVNYENTSGKRVRTGLVVLPVLMGVLNSLSSAPPQMHLPRFKLVASLSETVHSPRNQRESDFIDQLLLQFTDLNTKTKLHIPTVIDTSHPYYAHELAEDFLLPCARQLPHSADVTGNFEFLELIKMETSQVKASLVPEHLNEEEFALLSKGTMGHVAHISEVLSMRKEEEPLTKEHIQRFKEKHEREFAARLDECVKRCSFDDGSADTKILLRFVDIFERLQQVGYTINVGGSYGVEILHHPIFDILLRQGFLIHMLAPPLIVPSSFADCGAIDSWLKAKKASMTMAQRAQYLGYSTLQGVGSLKHINNVQHPALSKPFPDT